MGKVQHFDAEALLNAVYQQPIGLRVSTNHPAGFRRLIYQVTRRKPALKVHVLQCPKSANAFLLVPNHVNLASLNEDNPE